MGGEFAYMSPEWAQEVKNRLQTELSPETMNHVTTSVCYVYLDCPDGKDKYQYFRCEDGKVVDLYVDEGAPPKAEFTITGKYDVYAKITRGEIKAHQALMTGKIRLKGNMVKALKLASVADRLNKVIEKVPTRY
jgi:putative sterol carrier protein